MRWRGPEALEKRVFFDWARLTQHESSQRQQLLREQVFCCPKKLPGFIQNKLRRMMLMTDMKLIQAARKAEKTQCIKEEQAKCAVHVQELREQV